MLLKLVIAPDPVLEKVAKPVEIITDKLKRILLKMLDLMYEENGIGLAAPQVGISQRFFVMHIDDNEKPYFFINPVIIKKSKEIAELQEACLSVPEQSILIHRPESITVEYLDINGKKNIENFNGLHSRCIQHEIDHLDGIIIIDHIESKIERNVAKQKSVEIKQHISG